MVVRKQASKESALAGPAGGGASASAPAAAGDAGMDTPAMRQWAQAKQQVPDALLFFRMGDFYELFHQDAEEIAARLGLTLTSRTKDRSVPMAGVPYHSADQYIRRLLALGYRIAICEQLEDPAATKGLVRRGVVRVITPGTVIEESLLPGESNNFLAALCPPIDSPGFLGFQAGRVAPVDKKGKPLVDFANDWGVAWLDISTGSWGYEEGSREVVEDWLVTLSPAELLVPGPTWDGKALTPFQPVRPTAAAANVTAGQNEAALAKPEHAGRTAGAGSPRLEGTAVVGSERAQFDPLLASEALSAFFARRKGFTLPVLGPGLGACGAILHYLRSTQFDVPETESSSPLPVASFSGGLKGLSHIEPPERAGREKGMVLEGDAAKHLELVESPAGVARSLLGSLKLNKTAAGTRLMKQWILQPLKDIKAIVERQDGLALLLDQAALLQELRKELAALGDMERLTARVCTERANGRDLAALATSLQRVGVLSERLNSGVPGVAAVAAAILRRLAQALTPPEDVIQAIATTLREGELPAGITDGELIAAGVSAELDDLRVLAGGGKEWIAQLEQTEQQRTGIGSLKVGYNRVFGYYIEITHTHAKAVPADYIRKQTLTNAERYVTPDLKAREEGILSAETRSKTLEYTLFCELRARVATHVNDLQQVAQAAAELDVLCAWAEVARSRNWVRPQLTKERTLTVKAGRHPVLEQLLSAGEYVANDVSVDAAKQQILILTGPNMAGKSTYLRQVALLVVLAQAGCYVPAEAATIGVVDRLFTRIGARDDLTAGRSTFMVEMVETAHILRRCTPQSLVILDEVGRGTSTFDGLSIAWAMVEHFHDAKDRGARVLFATHYHELTEIVQTRRRVANYHVEVREYEGQLAFLYRVAPGAALRSFGIGVAKLAGLPGPVVARSLAILKELESADAAGHIRETLTGALRGDGQMSLFGDPKMVAIVEELKGIDPDTLTLEEVKRVLRGLIEKARRV